jgi:hypothetical protein
MCDNRIYDYNYNRYVGYEENESARFLFSIENLNNISRKITQLLDGVEPTGRPILVPRDTIASVMSNIYGNFVAPTSDIYSRYIIPNGQPQVLTQYIVDQTIETIVSTVRTDYAMRANNAKLTAWTTVYGNFNEHGLRAHSIIKVQEKRPNPMEFNMNY